MSDTFWVSDCIVWYQQAAPHLQQSQATNVTPPLKWSYGIQNSCLTTPKLIVSMTHPQQSTIFLVRREAVFQSSPASTLTWLRSRSGTPFNIKRNASSGDSSFLPHPQNRLKSKRRNWTAECKKLELVPLRTKNHSELWGPWKVLNLYRLGQRVGWWKEISIIWSCKALLYEPTNGLYRNIIGGCWCRAFAEFHLNPLLSMKQYVSEVVLLGLIFMMFVNTME